MFTSALVAIIDVSVSKTSPLFSNSSTKNNVRYHFSEYQSFNNKIMDNFCIALLSGVHKLTAFYSILQHFLS